MGRIAYTVPKGRFVFRNAANQQGLRMLYIQYYLGGTPVYRTTNITIPEDAWDPDKQRVRAQYQDATKINHRLKTFKDELDNALEKVDGQITLPVLRAIVAGTYRTYDKHTSFIEYAWDINEKRYAGNELSFATYNNFKTAIRHFEKFLDENAIPHPTIGSLTADLIDRYKMWNLEVRKMKLEPINRKLAPLIKAAQCASENDYISQRTYSTIYKCYFELKSKRYASDSDNERIRYLTDEQVAQFIEIYNKMKDVRRRRIMEYFLFSYYACGLRISDIITLEWNQIDFEKSMIVKLIVKTKNKHKVPLCREAMEIIEKRKAEHKNDRFVFNLLPEDFNLDDPQLLDFTIKSKNRNFQNSLRTIGEYMKLPFPLTMHVARHTFAVKALNNGMNVHMISKLLGHSTSAITERVYAEFLQETINTELTDKLPFDFSSVKA